MRAPLRSYLYPNIGTDCQVALEVGAKLNAAIRTALKDPELIKRQEALGVRVVTDSRLEPAEHKKYVEAEMTRWGKIIKDSGETAD